MTKSRIEARTDVDGGLTGELRVTAERHDTDEDPVIRRVYELAEQRQREAQAKEGRRRLRELVGLGPEPKNFRERILGPSEDEPERTGLRAKMFGKWK